MHTEKSGRISVRLCGVAALGLLLASASVSAGPPEFAPGAAKANAAAFSRVSLPERVNGEAAIVGLGDSLPAVAAYYGKTTAEFVRLLREDDTAWIDTKGRLLYIDRFPQPAGESEASDVLQETPFPLNETFTLNSRPGSQRVIYLDFDGHQTSGTAWNSSSGVDPIISPAYTRDGDPAFSDQELQYIQGMWRQVAEDFAPFDVNVTTQYPGEAAITRSGSSDDYYGTRVVITVDNFDNCGCGGFAYLTAFNDVGDTYKPAFVFNTGLVGAGEAITHEVGHNLSLHHDGAGGGVGYYQGHGDGATGWAPIMGVGYYQDLVQWSQGEYSGANEDEDDMARIQLYGALLVGDDHSDSDTGATVLDTSTDGTTVGLDGTGLIRSRDDVDVFSFLSGNGSYSISVNPAPVSPNLDIRAELRDSAGVLVASANPVNSLPAALGGSLVAGEYFLTIDGVGKGDPLLTGYTDYGSLGHYSVSGTVADPGGLSAPVAAAAAPDYVAGVAPHYVGFDGAGSTDADGSVVDWVWDFGDGSGASGASANNTYSAPGTYTVNLTVTDNDNLSDSDSLIITVDNQAPIAVAGADTTSGTAPVTVDFSSAGSQDQDSAGSITAYSWDFGDGSSSSTANPSHPYAAAGSFDAVLTVTDDLGASDESAALRIEVAAPPFVDQSAGSEQLGAGTVTRDYLATHAADTVEQMIRERESGGKPANRHSYLQHTWVFNVQQGDEVTLSLTGRQSNSADGDQMQFAYSIAGGSYTPLPIVLGTSHMSFNDLPLSQQAQAGGEIRVRVTDSDQRRGNRSLDTVYVDEIRIRTISQGGVAPPPSPAPDPATGLAVEAMSSSRLDLNWNDNSSNETGFRVERSTLGSAWTAVTTVGANQQDYSDTGLNALTEYFYRVLAVNGGVDATSPSNTASAITLEASAITLNSASGYKVKGRQWVSLAWSPAGVDVYRDNKKVATVTGTTYEDNIGVKGGGSYDYKICSSGSISECSNTLTVIF